LSLNSSLTICGDCLEDTLDLIATSAAKKMLEINYFLDDQLPAEFIGDVTRLRQILVNLLTNAVKFTEQGEIIVTVSGDRLDDEYILTFSVKDTGIGIPRDKLSKLFRSFSQVDASTTRRYGGTGLGLAISKRLCELMGGDMWVESEEGVGSTFRFTITPLVGTAQEMPPFRRSDQPALAGQRVLIVDDIGTSRMLLQQLTERWGMHPISAVSGQKALEVVEQGMVFDLALVDHLMPGMDGVALVREIQRRLGESAPPTVLLTSSGLRKRELSTVKITAFLGKPIKPEALYNLLVPLMGGHIQSSSSIPAVQGVASEDVSAALIQEGKPAAEPSPLRILVAEDNAINQKVVLRILNRLGHRADVTANGLEVLEALMRQTYDVVLMDVQMPEMDGLEATRLIRKQWPLNRQPRIIALTANAMKGDEEKCLAAGMNDYVSKPVRVEALAQALTHCHPLGDDGQVPEQHPHVTSAAEEPASVGGPEIHYAVDEEALDEFTRSLGEGGLQIIIEIIEMFLESAPQALIQIQNSIVQQDSKAIMRIAHKLRPNAGQLAAYRFSDMCRVLETLAETGQLSEAESHVADMQMEFVQVATHLKQKLNNYQTPGHNSDD
jgi:CheY-like chemotaxis protein/HPt (histidine-containing phosphotransfer) domain-containing protein/anti-sigma regulatory factor (Ser/Thr protein kinase)